MRKQLELLGNVRLNKNEILFNHFNYTCKQYKPLKNKEVNAAAFLSLNTPKQLCVFFNQPFTKLVKLINSPEYKVFSIPKKKGGSRLIEAPCDDLKLIQTQINSYLQSYYTIFKPKNIHGFVLNTNQVKANIFENAKLHTNKKYVLNIDLEDFFDTISTKRIYNLLSSELFDFNQDIAKALTFLCTYEGKLPTGAPSSPILSNLICLELDHYLLKFCEGNKITYSRYADDITFSSDEEFNKNLIQELKEIIESFNFKINSKKTRLKSSNRKQTVTGLIVNNKVNIDRKKLKIIRAIIHDCKVNGLEKGFQKHYKLIDNPSKKEIIKFRQKISGYLNFIKQVNGENRVYKKLKADFESLL